VRDDVTREDPVGPAMDTIYFVACTLRHMGLRDLADTVIDGDLEGARLRCQAMGLGWQADALAGLLDR
jgi:hypothetical protein